jgi:hypothetical protein
VIPFSVLDLAPINQAAMRGRPSAETRADELMLTAQIYDPLI